ncbi:aa3-type cytochrome c oxidase subunit IV [Rhodospirillaceae bacterium SYSU D60014]|jgi:hypothetical protein
MASDNDYLRDHERTWAGFTKLMTWSVIVTVLILIGMALFLL